MDLAGDIKLSNSVGGALHINPAGMVARGNNIAELLDLFNQFLTEYTSHVHGTGVGPSSPPVVPPIAIQTLLNLIKGTL